MLDMCLFYFYFTYLMILQLHYFIRQEDEMNSKQIINILLGYRVMRNRCFKNDAKL